MKFSILLCCIFSVIHAETQKEFTSYMQTTLLKALNKCFENGIKGECSLFCMFQEIKIMKADGTIDNAILLNITDRIKKFSPDISTKVQEASGTCIAKIKKEKDMCKYALNLLHCYRKERKSKGIPDIFLGNRLYLNF